MDKLCFGSEAPEVSLEINCMSSCCASKLDKRDEIDTIETPPSPEKEIVCCCFVRKRHAKVVRSDKLLQDGKDIEGVLL